MKMLEIFKQTSIPGFIIIGVPKPVMDKEEEIKLRNIYKKLEIEV